MSARRRRSAHPPMTAVAMPLDKLDVWLQGRTGAAATNLAMLDGAELGKAIAAYPGDIEAALTAYEEALFPRSESEYADAYELLDLCLGDQAPFGLIAFFTGAPAAASAR